VVSNIKYVALYVPPDDEIVIPTEARADYMSSWYPDRTDEQVTVWRDNLQRALLFDNNHRVLPEHFEYRKVLVSPKGEVTLYLPSDEDSEIVRGI